MQACVLLRVLFFPAFLLGVYGPPGMRAEWVIFTLTATLGITNGYLTRCASSNPRDTLDVLPLCPLVALLNVTLLANSSARQAIKARKVNTLADPSVQYLT